MLLNAHHDDGSYFLAKKRFAKELIVNLRPPWASSRTRAAASWKKREQKLGKSTNEKAGAG